MAEMTSRERMLTALSNGRPDRLPCQVHGWMDYYLKTYLDGMDWWQAYERFGMDFAIYSGPSYTYSESDLANWRAERREVSMDEAGNHAWEETITTPKGTLHHAGSWNAITPWETEYLIKNMDDFEIWNEYLPLPTGIDFTALRAVQDRLGDRGIIRVHPYSFGQGSPWQSFCTLFDTSKAIYLAMDKPEVLHHILGCLLEKTLRVTEMWEGIPADMIEIGGGAGSSTVIGPHLFEEFCLPYDIKQVRAFQAVGLKVVYHLCGGLMPTLNLVTQTGSDGLETMTPPAMGGDCDLAAASRQVGDKLFFIGGFDQNAGFENGTPETARQLVYECFEATKDHAGYICCPSDHFFHGDPACLQAFADAAKECRY